MKGPRFLSEKEKECLIDFEHALRIGEFGTTDGFEKHLKLKMKDKRSDTHDDELAAFEGEQLPYSPNEDDKYILLGLFDRINELETEVIELEGRIYKMAEAVNIMIDNAQRLNDVPRP